MKILRRAQFKILVLLTALLIAVASLWTGADFLRVSADESTDSAVSGVISTDVKAIAYRQIGDSIFLGFELTESDYTSDFDEDGNADLFEHDFYPRSDNDYTMDDHLRYEAYIASTLTYWKDFSQMNSEGASLPQLYAYWNGSSVGETLFANTVAHRTTMKKLEYGFLLVIPAETTFPSFTYVMGKCQGEPVMYKTTENRAFYFDGSVFKALPYAVIETRESAMAEVSSVNYDNYYAAERTQVQALVNAANENIKLSFTNAAVAAALSQFYVDLEGVMTIADYTVLAQRKEVAKQELSAYFNGLSQSAYGEAEWKEILAIQNECEGIIDGLKSLGEVDKAVFGVKYAVGSVLTEANKAAFAEYCTAAAVRLESAFDESLYYEAERAQGVALIEEGKAAIAQAATYSEADALTAEYIARIYALKTKTQVDEENQLQDGNDGNSDGSSSTDSGVSGGNSSSNSGCASTVSAMSAVLMAAAVGVICIIKKKKDGLER